MSFEIKTPPEQHAALFKETAEACLTLAAVTKAASLTIDKVPEDARILMVYFCEQMETIAEQVLKTAGIE